MKRLVIFLVRKRLGLKRFEEFQFVGQKTDAVYYFTRDEILKNDGLKTAPSSVSLNWLLNDKCAIRRVNRGTYN